MGKMIACLGAEKGDLPYHIAVLFAALDKTNNILVIDNSIRHDLARSLKSMDNEVAQQGHVTFMHDKNLAPNILEQYSFTIIYEGYSMSEDTIDTIASADQLLLFNDYSLFCNDYLKDLYTELDARYGEHVYAVPATMLCIGKTGNKIKEKKLLSEAGIKQCAILTIEENPQDRDGYINLQLNGRHKLTAMSAEYREALINFTIECTGLPEKQIRRAAKK